LAFKYYAVINTCGTTFERPQIFFTEHQCAVAVSNLGKTSLVFVQPGAKVDSSYYCDVVLHQGLLPDIQKLSGNNFTFQQDGAAGYLLRQTVAVWRLHVPEFVEPENWPPNNPDLNSVIYLIYGALQQLVYRRRRIRDVEHLKEVLQTYWEQIGKDVIDHAIRHFCKRLSLVVATGGGHTEHRFE